MNKLPIILIASSLFFASCKKEVNDSSVSTVITTGTVLKQGTFVSNSKSTSGTVKVVKDANNQLKLVFENFKTGSGPDVRVWLAPSTSPSAGNYQDVGVIKGFSGAFIHDLGSNIDYTANNRVLIWCEDFAVLFGHAVLQ